MPITKDLDDSIKELIKALEVGMHNYPPSTPALTSRAALLETTLKLLGWTQDPSSWSWYKTDAEGIKQQVVVVRYGSPIMMESLEATLKSVTFP